MERTAEEHLGAPVRSGRVSAAVAVFVRDGQVRFARTWGWEDPERRVPVDLDNSRFAIGSISKVFTAVALAGLKQRGVIRSYSDPVNAYLASFRLPDSHGEAITLDHLATHTAGLDEVAFGQFSEAPTGGPATPDGYEDRRPGFFRPPGSLTTYSSYGVSVLGLAVANASGTTFQEAVARSILRPLHMDRTLVGPPDGPVEHEVVASQPGHPGNVLHVYARPVSVPAAGVLSTGQDMGRLLVALLDREGRQDVITPAMQDDLYRVHHEDAPHGCAHGLVFDVLRTGTGVRAHHGGLFPGNSCYIALAPSESMGLFFCYTDVKPVQGTPAAHRPPDFQSVRMAMLRPFGFSSEPEAASARGVAWSDSWREYLGSYLSVYRHHHGVGRLRSMVHPYFIQVERGRRGLRVDGIDGLVELEPGAFGSPGLTDSFAFFRDPSTGRMVLSRSAGFSSYEKPAPTENPRIVMPLLAALLAVCATGLLFPAWRIRGAGVASVAAVGLATAVVGGVGLLFGTHAFGMPYFVGVAWPILSVRACAFLAIPLAGLLSWTAARGWSPRPRGRAARAHLVLLALGAWMTVAVLVHVGLIGLSPLR